jgi:TetR/AcrR family transcriptional repressor of nem operon
MTVTERKHARQHILDVAKLIIGKKGFSAVGLNEVLQAAQVPKGSFYNYFGSKDVFGVALLDGYFETYMDDVTRIFSRTGLSEYQKLDLYWQQWIDNQTSETESGNCLAVKLGAEVADLSEPMRLALERGTSRIIAALAASIARGVDERSVTLSEGAERTAFRLYSLWLGASVMAKITRSASPFVDASVMTRAVLKHPG